MLVGYMRASSDTDRQSTALKPNALLPAGVDERHPFEDRASGARDDRPGLAAFLKHLRTGDMPVVWRLDRLGRSLPHLLEIVTDLRDRAVALRSLTDGLDIGTPRGELLSRIKI